jgi:hypothetical protein
MINFSGEKFMKRSGAALKKLSLQPGSLGLKAKGTAGEKIEGVRINFSGKNL